MLELHQFDLDVIATALSDQTDYERQWLVDPASGELVLWTSDTGIDGRNPVELDELDEKFMAITPLPGECRCRWRSPQPVRTSARIHSNRTHTVGHGSLVLRGIRDFLAGWICPGSPS